MDEGHKRRSRPGQQGSNSSPQRYWRRSLSRRPHQRRKASGKRGHRRTQKRHYLLDCDHAATRHEPVTPSADALIATAKKIADQL